jgi:hypothetical protein
MARAAADPTRRCVTEVVLQRRDEVVRRNRHRCRRWGAEKFCEPRRPSRPLPAGGPATHEPSHVEPPLQGWGPRGRRCLDSGRRVWAFRPHRHTETTMALLRHCLQELRTRHPEGDVPVAGAMPPWPAQRRQGPGSLLLVPGHRGHSGRAIVAPRQPSA